MCPFNRISGMGLASNRHSTDEEWRRLGNVFGETFTSVKRTEGVVETRAGGGGRMLSCFLFLTKWVSLHISERV